MKNESKQYWDLIGDIHGELEALRGLLSRLGYVNDEGRIIHPEGRKVIFVGDLIDRGPDSRGVLHLVKQMMDDGTALAVMGNHEFNFVSYLTPDGEGGFLRPHHGNYPAQVAVTLQSFEGYEEELDAWVDWMKDLPFSLDLEGLRVVHASWIPDEIDYLRDKSLADAEFLVEANRKSSRAYQAIERVLKGVEIDLPEGFKFLDSNGVPRNSMRVKWWQSMQGKALAEIAFPDRSDLPHEITDFGKSRSLANYSESEPPVFFGHYKLIGYDRSPPAPNVACLDFGLGHGGPATAYRWGGEAAIDPANFVVLEREEFPVYQVLVDDNFHFVDPEENRRYGSGCFERYEDALAKAMVIVDEELENCYKPGESAEWVAGIYRTYGESPFVRPTPVDLNYFSSLKYAEKRVPEIIEELEKGNADAL